MSAASLLAATFVISTNSTTAQTLGSSSGQTGTGRAIRDNTGLTGLVINNGSSTNSTVIMQTADADVIQMNKAEASVTFNNYGTLTSLNASADGSQAIDFNAITSGSNIFNNCSTGIIQASEADAFRPGVNGYVYNDGTIKSTTTTGSSSDGNHHHQSDRRANPDRQHQRRRLHAAQLRIRIRSVHFQSFLWQHTNWFCRPVHYRHHFTDSACGRRTRASPHSARSRGVCVNRHASSPRVQSGRSLIRAPEC